MSQVQAVCSEVVEVSPYKAPSVWHRMHMGLAYAVGLLLLIVVPSAVLCFFDELTWGQLVYMVYFGTLSMAVVMVVWWFVIIFQDIRNRKLYYHPEVPKVEEEKLLAVRHVPVPTTPATAATTTTAPAQVAHRIICMEDPVAPGRVLYMRKRNLEFFPVTERLFFDSRIGPVMAPPATPLPGELREVAVALPTVKIHLLRIVDRAVFDSMFRRNGTLYVPALSFVRGDNGPIEVIFDDWSVATGIEKDGYDAFSALAATGFTLP